MLKKQQIKNKHEIVNNKKEIFSSKKQNNKSTQGSSFEKEPPILVAIVGPKGVGKTTLLRSLIKRYTKRKIDKIEGPVTLFTEKSKRMTFFECENEITSMIDIAKVADLVILIIDASFGLEIETFEFVSVLKAHGFCRLVSVLTKLDLVKQQKKAEIKKTIRDRLHSDIYSEAKLFYLTGILKELYKEKEIVNFSRFISITKANSLIWKTTHSHVFVDKIQVNRENTINETIFYGYLKGKPMRDGFNVCIPGIGDFQVESIVSILDPCPLKENNQKKIRKIIDQKKILYAPMSNIEDTLYDESEVYIDVKNTEPTTLNIKNIETKNISLIKESIFCLKEEKKEKILSPVIQKPPSIEFSEKEEEPLESLSEEEEDILENEEKKHFLKKRFVFCESDDEFNEEKKRSLKIERIEKRFDDITKEEVSKKEQNIQTELKEFTEKRMHFGGYPGEYVKITIKNLPDDLNITAKNPIIIGCVESIKNTFITAKIIRQRFFPRILKTKEPLIFSIGWRRFQSIPIFSLQDATRNKMLKYTPENMHCFATFYGPHIPQGTGICAFKKLTTEDGFRVSISGTVVEMKNETTIRKKLKLIGKPVEIKQKTAFISDMFTSSLEVTMFEGGLLKTTSGIRGKIKKAIHDSGMFRATFEDQIQYSDIVFMRTWHKVQPPVFFNPMTELVGEWKKMKLNKELREIHGISINQNEDSFYRKIERPEKIKKDFKISKEIMKALPFSVREKEFSIDKTSYLNNRIKIPDFLEKKKEESLKELRKLKEEKEKKYCKKQEKNKIEQEILLEKEKLEKKEKEKKYLKNVWMKKQVKETFLKKKKK